MYKSCITEQSAQRQREIEAGLLQTMKTRAYEDISVSDLCSSLNIPRKSFYRYFSSKQGALYALIDHTLMDFSDIFFPVSPNNILFTLEQFFLFWLEHDALLSVLSRNGLGGILIQRAIENTMLENTILEYKYPAGFSRAKEYTVTFVISGLIALVFDWHHRHFQESPEKMAFLALNLLTDQYSNLILPE